MQTELTPFQTQTLQPSNYFPATALITPDMGVTEMPKPKFTPSAGIYTPWQEELAIVEPKAVKNEQTEVSYL